MANSVSAPVPFRILLSTSTEDFLRSAVEVVSMVVEVVKVVVEVLVVDVVVVGALLISVVPRHS